RKLLHKRQQVRAKKLDLLEFRSCFVGSSRRTLQVLRKFFGAEVVGAPMAFSGFGHLDVGSSTNLNQDAYNAFIQAHSDVRQYDEADGLTQGKVALAVQLINSHEANTFATATNEAALREWVVQFFGTSAAPPLNNIPVHFLATRPTSVPGQRDW